MLTGDTLLIVGSGGAQNIPRIGCRCAICEEARTKDGRFKRNGPSVFLTGPQLLIDTPDDIIPSLERERIDRVRHLAYSHWHPDHTNGRRVIELLNGSLFHPEEKKCTDIWLASWIHEDFRRFLGLEDNLRYFEKNGVVRIHEIVEGEPVQLSPTSVLRAYRMKQSQQVPDQAELACFQYQSNKRKIVLAMDETKEWRPDNEILRPDVLVLQTGWFEKTPDGQQIVPFDHWVRKSEASFEETLRIIKLLEPKKTVLVHLDHINARSYTDYCELEREYLEYNLRFAYDGLSIAV